MNIYDPLSSRPSDRPIPDLSTSVLANQHYHAPWGSLLCCRWCPASHTETCFTAAPHRHWDLAVRGLLDSFLLCSHVQFPDALSIGPCAGSQDTLARTASDSLVPCTTPCAQLSELLPFGVVVAIYGTAIEGSTLGEPWPNPCAISRRYVFSSIPKFPAPPHILLPSVPQPTAPPRDIIEPATCRFVA
jgi:hypothetical protein